MPNHLLASAFAQNSSEISSKIETDSQVGGTNSAKNEFSPASFIPLVVIFAIFYFLVIRPQSKKLKEHQQMLKQLKIGDKVITSGGIIGIVREVIEKEEQVRLEIADQVIITVLRQNISQVEKTEKPAIEHKKRSKKQ